MTADDFQMIVSGLFLSLFVVIYGYLLYLSWRKAPLPTIRTQLVFTANALAATVGTIVATLFGQELPPPPNAGGNVAANVAPNASPQTPESSALPPTAALKSLVIVKATNRWRQNMPAFYVIAYFVVGFAAIFTWLVKDPPEMVNTPAYITFGLMANIVRAAF